MFLLSAAQANQHVDDNYHPLNVLDDNYMEIVFKYLSCEGQPCIKMTKTKRRIMATHTPPPTQRPPTMAWALLQLWGYMEP